MQAIIEARKVEKSYGSAGQGSIQVIAATDLAIYPDEILAVLGPSGSGKSTLLRMLTGLAAPSAGEVIHHGHQVGGPCENVSIVFQSFALFPWLTVMENVAAPLKARGVGLAERTERSLRILDTVGLDGFENAYPKELSGGMKQRVGFARALVVEPEVLFMDEPFSALDVLTAENLRGELMELWQSHKMPTRAVFLVTHNIEEAILLADRVIVLGKNPATIRTDFRVGLGRPRDRKSAPFTHLVDYVYNVLTRPELAPAQPQVQTAEAPKPVRPKYQMLPHARRGAIAGLLEMLAEHNGRADIFRLAAALSFEIDDLLPVVDAAVLLGFAKVEEGDAILMPEGRAFAEADILRRKELFRTAAMAHASLIRQIRRALEDRPEHNLPEAYFQDLLEENFTEDEAKLQLETATRWGRYAELFDRDPHSRRFFIPDEPLPDEAEQGTAR